jgi:MinD superfamily P-loop ATPase
MVQFKKNSIFTCNGKDGAEREDILKGGILAVWGSPGSGKTTIAVKIAKHLADKKKNVVLVLCDMAAPMLPCICPTSSLEVAKNQEMPYGSLGSILSAPHVTEQIIKYNMITLKKIPYFTMIGMLKGENEYTYASYSKVQAQEFLAALRNIAPYVIIDCGSYIANDILSAVSLMECDGVLRLSNCDLKSVSYLSSQLKLLENSKWNSKKQYNAVSNIKSNHGMNHIVGALGSISFQLPFSKEIEEQYLAGNLLGDLSSKNSKGFRKEIEHIAGEVFGC